MRFSIDLDSIDSIDFNLPSEFIEFLKIANAGFPRLNSLKIDSKNYDINNFLNFNKDAEVESFKEYFEDFKDILASNEIPFGRDGFGNLYLLCLGDKNIIRFYEHESGEKEDLMSLESFIDLILKGEGDEV